MGTMARSVGSVMVAVMLMLLSLPSCSSVTPHENFKMHMNAKIGMSIDSPPRITGIDPEDLISSTTLPNGNLESTYRYRGTCRYSFEYNSKTRIIVGWRFEGSEHDCEIVP